ncbi:MAG: dihydropyrimidinase [Candidatus Binatia bacterium]|nr:dihydropyrimidinase [Candidatus Binatia bacterium]
MRRGPAQEGGMDLIIRNGTIVTASDIMQADVGIEAGKVKQIGYGLGPAAREIDARGQYLFPGGVDVHTHVDFALLGHRSVDDFYSGTVAAACGGVTTIVDYALPEPGQSIQETIETWQKKAQGKAVIDYSFHPAILEPSARIIAEMADAVADGYTSFKLFMIGLARFDELAPQYMKVMAQAGRLGALTNIHAEDQCLISYLTEQLNAAGKFGVRYFADSRPRLAEGLAVQRAITMARYAEAPIYLVHLSCEEALRPLAEARACGQIVYGETRPIYLHLSRERFEEPDGERYVGWPPLREASQMQAMWDGLRTDTLQTVATDHCGWTLAQKKAGKTVDELLPGMSNLETMLPMLYSEGVRKSRLSLNRFVEIVSTNPAKLFGLYPQKGTIAVGSDADIVLFDPHKIVTIRHADMHSRADYELYEGFQVTGWPAMTLSRGEIIVDNGKVLGQAGRGRLLRRQRFTVL